MKTSYLLFKQSADLDNMLAVIIHGNVHFCINMPREDVFKKEFVGNQNFIYRMFAVKLC